MTNLNVILEDLAGWGTFYIGNREYLWRKMQGKLMHIITVYLEWGEEMNALWGWIGKIKNILMVIRGVVG